MDALKKLIHEAHRRSIWQVLGIFLATSWGVLQGVEFLNYNVIAEDPHHGQHYGLLLIEGGVGITVTCAMTSIYYLFAGRAR